MKKTLFKSAIVLSILTIIGKLIGFIRVMVIAYIFGADGETDAYYLANGLVSNILYALSTAIAVSFLPIYIEKKVIHGENSSSEYTSKVITVLSVLAVGVSIVVCILAPALAKISAPGYEVEHLNQVILYLRVLAIGIIFSLVTSLLKSILDAEKIYGYGAFSGIVYSMVTIATVIFFYKSWGIMSLVISAPAAYFIQYIFLNVRIRKCVRITPRFDLHDKDLMMLIKVSLPVLLSNATVEINQLLDRMLASHFEAGAVSALSYSANLDDMVISIISSTLITIWFTEFSNNSAKKDIDALKQGLRKGISILCLILLPIALIAVMYGKDIVMVVYGRGGFGEKAIWLTTVGITIYAMGWITVSIEKLCTKLFFSLNDTKIPMRISICVVLTNALMSILLVQSIGFAGIVLGTVIAELLAVVLNLVLLHKKIGNLGMKSMMPNLMKMLVSGFGTVVILYLIKSIMLEMGAFPRIIIAAISGLMVYGILLILLKCEEIEVVKKIILRKKSIT